MDMIERHKNAKLITLKAECLRKAKNKVKS